MARTNKSKAKIEPQPPRAEDEVFAELASLCAAPGYAHVLAYFCYRDNFIWYGEEVTADDFAPLHSKSRLIRTEISTLVGLLVRAPLELALPAPETLQHYIDKTEQLLAELHDAIASVWFKDFDPAKVMDEGFDPFTSGASLREPIFYSGDSAYDFQYREFAKRKYADDRAWLVDHKGFGIASAVRMAIGLGKLLLEKKKATQEKFKTLPIDQWTVLPGFMFTGQELSQWLGMDLATVSGILAAFSLPADDRNEGFSSLQAYNATNGSPIVAVGDDKYVLFQHYSLMEAIYESPFYWMGADRKYAPRALANRGRFTEVVAFDCLKRAFAANTFMNVHIERVKGEEIGEIDVLAVFGDRAIILQAKSKGLSLEARKGNDLQIKDDFKKAVQASYNQALLCSKTLLGGGYKLRDAEGQEIVLPLPIKQIFPVCVVADHYPALAFQARQFLAYKADDNIAAPLVIDLFALDAITEMLDSPLRLLSYLALRAGNDQQVISTHELTLLSVHITHNLWISDKYNMVMFDDDIAVHLDAAMAVRREGLPGEATPDGVLKRLAGTPVGQIISDIEARPDSVKIDLGLLLLSLGKDFIDDINRAIDVTKANGLDGQLHDFTLAFSQGGGITVHCNDRPDDEAAELLYRHCALRKYSQKEKSWFGLVIRPGTGDMRMGLKLEGDWVFDSQLEQAVSTMPSGISHRQFDTLIGRGGKKQKIGRNEPCPCGSERKYKKCCLQ